MFRNNYDNDTVTLYALRSCTPSVAASVDLFFFHLANSGVARRRAASSRSNMPPSRSSKDP